MRWSKFDDFPSFLFKDEEEFCANLYVHSQKCESGSVILDSQNNERIGLQAVFSNFDLLFLILLCNGR